MSENFVSKIEEPVVEADDNSENYKRTRNQNIELDEVVVNDEESDEPSIICVTISLSG